MSGYLQVGTIFEDNDSAEWFEVMGLERVGSHVNDTLITFKNLDTEDLEKMFVEYNWGVVQCLVGLERPGRGNSTTWRKLSPEECTYETWDEKNSRKGGIAHE